LESCNFDKYCKHNPPADALAWYSRTLASTQTKICTILCAIEKKKPGQKELKFELWPTKYVGINIYIGHEVNNKTTQK
jgi:hypothetical protein